MIAEVELPDGMFRREERTPICGEDFCDRCGDCLSCCGNEWCAGNGWGPHRWVVYLGGDEAGRD